MGNVPADPRDGSGRYEVRVTGHLDTRWASWFDGFSLAHAGDGTTVLTGFIVDQAALHGVLRRLGDVGLPIVSVTRTDTEPADVTTELTTDSR
jgi:hypothetical protein